jgi:hypothetical protein
MTAFPCPFAPFEHLMWLDDAADYPMAFPIISELTGTIDRALAQEALEAVCARHPLLAARVVDDGERPQWVATPEGVAKANAIDWREDTVVAQRALDLRVESGVRVEFIRDAERWRMAWHFHHCCCDGVGAATAVGEWLLIYDALANGRDWRRELRTFDDESLARRAQIRSRRTERSQRSQRSQRTPRQQSTNQQPQRQRLHGPQAHDPQAHGPQAHDPQAHGPQAHGPQAHGPQAQGQQAQGQIAKGEIAQGEIAQGQQAQGQIAQGQQVQGQLVKGQLVQGQQATAGPEAETTPKVTWWRRVRGIVSHVRNTLRVVLTTPAELASPTELNSKTGAGSDAPATAPGAGRTASRAAARAAAHAATDATAHATTDAATDAAISERTVSAIVRVRHWEADQWLELRRLAESRGATVNDVLLTALVLAVRDWNQRYASGRQSRPIRIMMPTNQRISGDGGLSATNVLGYAMLDRAARETQTPAELLESLRRETAMIARQNLSIRFMISLGVIARWPRLLEYALSRQGSWATAVLSNLGEVGRRVRKSYRWDGDRLAAGDLRLEAIYGAPPIRRGTRVALGVSVFRQRLAVAALFDPHHFNAADQEEFLDRFQAALAMLAKACA